LATDHRAEVLALYRSRHGEKARIPHDVWHRCPQLMRDKNWTAAQALEFVLGGGDWQAHVTKGFQPRANFPDRTE
jgi:hypothetical protein